ncbi:hypothetical protein D1871_22545 [Nakamurella silvestris]|nr:hypothetical protein D1871_22545 [Nakamurella silvestris]
MGLWATYVVCRTGSDLAEVSAITERSEGLDWSDERPGSWKIGQYLGHELTADSDDLLLDLTAETGAPALLAHVMDSNAAVVQGCDPGGGVWQAGLAVFEDFEYYLSPAEAADMAYAWGLTAGLTPHRGQLLEVFNTPGPHPDVREPLSALFAALGLPEGG